MTPELRSKITSKLSEKYTAPTFLGVGFVLFFLLSAGGVNILLALVIGFIISLVLAAIVGAKIQKKYEAKPDDILQDEYNELKSAEDRSKRNGQLTLVAGIIIAAILFATNPSKSMHNAEIYHALEERVARMPNSNLSEFFGKSLASMFTTNPNADYIALMDAKYVNGFLFSSVMRQGKIVSIGFFNHVFVLSE